MTTARQLLSVRLEAGLAEALERHCAQTGASRSHVVKQSVAQYLVAQTGPTLGSLAEAVLPPAPRRISHAAPRRVAQAARGPRQKRFRDYVREKRHR